MFYGTSSWSDPDIVRHCDYTRNIQVLWELLAHHDIVWSYIDLFVARKSGKIVFTDNLLKGLLHIGGLDWKGLQILCLLWVHKSKKVFDSMLVVPLKSGNVKVVARTGVVCMVKGFLLKRNVPSAQPTSQHLATLTKSLGAGNYESLPAIRNFHNFKPFRARGPTAIVSAVMAIVVCWTERWLVNSDKKIWDRMDYKKKKTHTTQESMTSDFLFDGSNLKGKSFKSVGGFECPSKTCEDWKGTLSFVKRFSM